MFFILVYLDVSQQESCDFYFDLKDSTKDKIWNIRVLQIECDNPMARKLFN